MLTIQGVAPFLLHIYLMYFLNVPLFFVDSLLRLKQLHHPFKLRTEKQKQCKCAKVPHFKAKHGLFQKVHLKNCCEISRLTC